MSQTHTVKGIKLDTPVMYRIRVHWTLDKKWAERIGGMSISTSSTAEEVYVSTLVSRFPDQAALSVVLNTLYELHLPLLSVECLDEIGKSIK